MADQQLPAINHGSTFVSSRMSAAITIGIIRVVCSISQFVLAHVNLAKTQAQQISGMPSAQ
jgi:hypothetical protein